MNRDIIDNDISFWMKEFEEDRLQNHINSEEKVVENFLKTYSDQFKI